MTFYQKDGWEHEYDDDQLWWAEEGDHGWHAVSQYADTSFNVYSTPEWTANEISLSVLPAGWCLV